MKRALVTGASGFVGANLARRLVADGHQVHLIVRPDSDLWRIKDIAERLSLHQLSLNNRKAVEDSVREIRPDWVFHLAVSGAYSWQNDLPEMISTNIIGTANLIEACLECGFEAFVNTGSSSEYGFKDHAPSEDEPLEPNSYYAVTKASATFLCQYIARSKRVHVPTLRLYSVFGPYEDPRRLIPTLILKGLEAKLPTLVDPTVARDYIYIDDVVDAYLAAAAIETGELGAIYNVGTGVQTTLSEIVEIARAVLRIADEPNWGSMPNRSWDSNSWVADSSKLRSALGWQHKHSVGSGFEKTVKWFRENPSAIAHYQASLAAPTGKN